MENNIDEEFILTSMNMFSATPSSKKAVQDVSQVEIVSESEQTLQTENVERESRKRRNKNDYESTFIRPSDITGRQEKTIYLRADYYNRINGLIQLYKNPRLSVFAYIDAVLEQHFETYKKEIKDVHNKLYKAPYDE